MEQFSVINAWLILIFRFLFVILDFRSMLRSSMYKPNDDQKEKKVIIRSDVLNLYRSLSDQFRHELVNDQIVPDLRPKKVKVNYRTFTVLLPHVRYH